MRSRGVGVVVRSRSEALSVGDQVAGDLGWCEGTSLPACDLEKVPPSVSPEIFLSLLGPSGLTAYFSMLEAGAVAPGETVVIAPGAGSVGSLAAQLARLRGARPIGIARGAEQCRAAALAVPAYSAILDADDPAIATALEEICPEGISLFLDGVGGAVHEEVLAQLAPLGRVVLLGFIAQYGEEPPARYGNAAPVLFKRATMTGFLLADWHQHFCQARATLAAWAADGTIHPLQAVWQGLEQAPHAFCALFGAAKPGKHVVRLVDEGN